jgi:hypothetical protein
MINRTNYESFIVDFAEGNLSGRLKAEMELFLEKNPDLLNEVELFKEAHLEADAVTFPGKSLLKQIPFEQTDVNSEYFQQQCIAYVEGFLTETEKALFLDMVNTDVLKKKELELFQKTVLVPNKFYFNEKLLLKKENLIHIIDDENFEMYCIAYLEGWLDQDGILAVDQFVMQNPERKAILDLYFKTRFIPDRTIVYPTKRQLKRFVLLNTRTKKYLAFASSAAAILVFGSMLFYSSQFTNKLQLAGSLINAPIKVDTNNVQKVSPASESAAINLPEQEFNTETPVKASNTSQLANDLKKEKQTMQKGILEPMNPIRVSELDCAPCKQFYREDKRLKLDQYLIIEDVSLSDNPQSEESLPDNETGINAKIKNLASAGISEIGKLTNTEIVVKKGDKQKTKIAFNSRYFAFSTSVKSKQSNF